MRDVEELHMIKVVIWTLGVVGKSAAPAIHAHPQMKLVGCYTRSPDKRGKDVGELCGVAPMRVRATGDIDALLALTPDCVLYVPQFPDVGEMVRILLPCEQAGRVGSPASASLISRSRGSWVITTAPTGRSSMAMSSRSKA